MTSQPASQPAAGVDITQRLLHAVADGDRQLSWSIAAAADRGELEWSVRYLCEAVRAAIALACNDDPVIAAAATRTIADQPPETLQFLDIVDALGELDEVDAPRQGDHDALDR